ncbi:MAG: glycoside hydrolase family 127 protein, partial [Lentisphaeria bacterium]|nr:glycoside hydrolase family 127 protein [Lentisphaeria bacterium]
MIRDTVEMRFLKSVSLNGILGNALRKTVENRLKKIDCRRLVDPFRDRSEADNMWRCEFWGKIVRSAIYAWCATQDPELRTIIDKTVCDLLSTQTADGCISSYPESRQLGGWDIWGRKYVLLGLLAYYREMNPDPEILNRIRRCARHLVRQAGELQNYGQHYGMASASSLRAIAETAMLSGDDEIMNSAVKLAKSGCCQLHNIFGAARIGIPPSEIGNGKAYEMTSCFQGLGALYALDHDP